ncbi:MAG: TerC family protein [Anaerolineae bacterium]
MDTTDILGVLTIVAQLIFLEGILSIDNAAVLGAMVSELPADQPVPYPAWLSFLSAPTSRLLGMQQSAALKVGLLGAYAGRGLMLTLASWVIHNPLLKVLGAAYLVRLAFEHLGEREDGIGAGERISMHRTPVFWLVVLNVELADLAFSLDNVVAAVALSNQLWVVMLGVALGILTMRFAAGVFTWLIKREPILATAAYLVVFNIGVELLLDEFLGIHFESWQKFAISAATLVLCVGYARMPFLHRLAPLWRWFARGMGIIDALIVWLAQPILLPFRLLVGQLAGALNSWRVQHPHHHSSVFESGSNNPSAS